MTKEDFDSSNIFQVNHRNCFRTLQNIVGFVNRFINGCRTKDKLKGALRKCILNEVTTMDEHQLKVHLRNVSPLSVEELDLSLKTIVRYLQLSLCDVKNAKRGFHKLLPFRDCDSILRVGGRLKNSSIPYDAKHPMLLPQCKITLMLLRQIHIDNHHVAPQSLLSITRQKFWPIGGARCCSKVFYHCVKCFRSRPSSIDQLMGNLPSNRTSTIAPFAHTGVDYAGPVTVYYNIRGKRPTKSYVAVFVCFSVKAVHLELVSDLTTDAFLACLKRFVSRRGKPIAIYSDNATNFTGAKEEFKRLVEFMKENFNVFQKFSANRGIKWDTIPPGSPHFGGLWESSVKRMKQHLVHVLKDRKLTFEELNTVLIEIEAILNSRPLTVQSENPADLKPLTPSNFLISGDACFIPDKEVKNSKPTLLKRWELISKIRKEYWDRLSLEYFHTLQMRSKWLKLYENLRENTVVLIKNDNTPPMNWEMGLIINVIKGNDNIARVVDLKTAIGKKRRCVSQVCPFPPLNENSMFAFENKKSDDAEERESDSKSVILQKDESLTSKQEKVRRSKRSKKQTFPILTTLVCIFLIIPFCLSGNSVNITQFNHHPGIFYDGVSKINLVSNEWHILMYFNLSSYWKQCNSFNVYVNNLKSLCDNEACQHLISQLSKRVDNINNVNIRIKEECQMKEHLRAKLKRNRRSYKAPLNAIGNFAHRWFGLLDSNYAEKLEEALTNVKSNENRIMMIVKNQTTIMDNTVNLMEANNKEVEEKLHILHNETVYLKDVINNQYKQVFFNTLSNNLLTLMSSYENIQKNIESTLKDFKKGDINPVLINPVELEEHLIQLKDSLGMGLKLPSTHFPEIRTIVQMSTVYGSNCLIFQLEVPLLKNENYHLYRMVPVPTYHQNFFTFIKPIRQYLAISLQQQMYYFLTSEEFEKCVEFYEVRICRQSHAMFHINENNHCEVNFFLNSPELTTQCDVVKSIQPYFWIQLHRPNQWLYSVKERSTLKVICNGDQPFQTRKIEGEGILEYPSNCNIHVNSIELPGTSVMYSTLILKDVPSVLPELNFTDDIPIKESSKPFVVSIKSLDSISNAIQRLKTEENVQLKDVDIKSDKGPDTYHIISFSFTGVILILAISLLMYYKCCRKESNKVDVIVRNPIFNRD